MDKEDIAAVIMMIVMGLAVYTVAHVWLHII
jgi:hypothetical protein